MTKPLDHLFDNEKAFLGMVGFGMVKLWWMTASYGQQPNGPEMRASMYDEDVTSRVSWMMDHGLLEVRGDELRVTKEGLEWL